MDIKSKIYLNNMKALAVEGPFNTEDEVCRHIEDLSLVPEDYTVIREIISRQILNIDHALSMYRNKKKKKDVEADPLDKNLIIIKGEVKK